MSLDAPARAEGPRGPMRGWCRSLSQAGMYFSGMQLPLGQSVDVTVDLPDPVGKFHAMGEVRYHRADDRGAGMGIRFTRLSQEDLARIHQFVARNA